MKITHTNKITSLGIHSNEDAPYMETVNGGLPWRKRRELARNKREVGIDGTVQVDLNSKQVRRVSAFAMKVVTGSIILTNVEISRDQNAMLRNFACFLPIVGLLAVKGSESPVLASVAPQVEAPAFGITAPIVVNGTIAA